MGRKNPETSLEAFRSLQSEEMIKTYNDILGALSILGEGTFEDISKVLKCKPDKIWRRMSELHEKFKLIHRTGNKRVLKSKRKGFTWKLNAGVEPLVTTVDKILPGKSLPEYIKAFKQQTPSNNTIERLF